MGCLSFLAMSENTISLIVCSIDEDGYHLFIEAEMNGKEARLLIDTGASRSVFDKNRINRFSENELITAEALSSGLGTNTMESHTINLESLKLGSLELKDFEAVLLDLSHVNESYASMELDLIDGVIGSDLLMQHQASIDFKKKVLKLY